MRFFKLLVYLAVASTHAACKDAQPPGAESPPAARAMAGVSTTSTADPGAVALPHAVYRQAMEHARKSITADNAKQKLDELDGQIEREKDMMQ